MSDSPGLFTFIHNQLIPQDQAFLHVSDLSIQRGYGIFDFFKIVDGKPLLLEYYLDRFYRSADLMNLTIPYSLDALREILFNLITKNNLPLAGVKMILTGGYSIDGYVPSLPNLIITQHPLVLPTPAQVQNGIKIITHAYIREMPLAKTINYTMGIRLLGRIKAEEAEDVLYYQNDIVTEFPRSNIFIVKPDNTVVTPAQNILSGITRHNVLSLAGKKYAASESTITLSDIYAAKEIFMTSTTKQILPIVQVDDTLIGNGKPGAITLELLNDLLRLEKEG